MLEHLVLVAFLQFAAPNTAPTDQAAKPVEMVCKTRPATGSLVAKRKICKPKSSTDKEAADAQDLARQFERSGSMFQSKPPGVSN